MIVISSSSKKDSSSSAVATASSTAAAAAAAPTTSSGMISTTIGNASSTLRLVRTWDVKCPRASKRMVGGVWTHTISLGMMTKKRRVTIEIYGNSRSSSNGNEDPKNKRRESATGTNSTSASTPTTRRGLIRGTGSRDKDLIDLTKELKDDDWIVVRILKPRRGRWGFHVDDDDEDDDSSEDDEDKKEEASKKDVSTKKKDTKTWIQDTIEDITSHTSSPSSLWKQQQDEEWMEYRRYNLEAITDETHHKNVVEAVFGLGNRREKRAIKFESDEQAQDFASQLQGLRELVKERAQDRLQAYKTMKEASKAKMLESLKELEKQNKKEASRRSNIEPIPETALLDSVANMDEQTPISLLVEIVSAQDLPIADRRSTDPYVTVYLGAQKIHKTIPIANDLNPVWTVHTGSLFLVECLAEEFFSFATGLLFRIVDNNPLSGNQLVGQCVVSQTELLQMDGRQRVSFPIDVAPALVNKKNRRRIHTPRLNLRVRNAKPTDKAFIKALNSIKRAKKEGIYADASFVAPVQKRVGGLLKRETKTVQGNLLYRTKPCPDPTRPTEETEWMTSTQINEETMKPSYEWIESGTGKLGKMYVEVLKCDGLPNLDATIPPSICTTAIDVTDPFCCLIYEDAIVNTDVIRDELNPRWVPWSQRAFIFRMGHPSSQLFIGVFDYDVGTAGLYSHDPAGRVTVDVTNFSPATEYVLTYNLYQSVLDNVRKPRGTITIRLRIEYDSFQNFAKGALSFRPLTHVNMSKKVDFKVAYFTCNGEENINRFAMEDLTAYRTELESLVGIRYFIRQALLSVIFWRGHKQVSIFGWKTKLPLHSVIAFVLGTTLIENLNLLPSYSLFCVSWLLAATNEHRVRHPSPWHGSLTIAQMWYAILAGKTTPMNISDHENEAAIRAYEEELERRFQEEKEQLKQRQEAMARLSELFDGGSSPEDNQDQELATKVPGGRTINPLAIALLPVQKALGQVCKVVRIIRSILMWDECYVAFITWNVCFFVGVACLWVPWSFFVRWMARILVWTLLGPWMKLVDLFVMPRLLGTNINKDDALQKLAKEQLQNLGIAKEAILLKKEEIMKERALKRYMFGRFAIKVPRFKVFRYRDTPLPQSYATSRFEHHAEIKIKKRSYGQTLQGDMVPTWGDAIDAEVVEFVAEPSIATIKAE